jgi:hypothetical protein
MRPEEIDLLPPGNDFDGLIGEHVFNLEVRRFDAGGVLMTPWYDTSDASVWTFVKRYSTDITEAWLVFEKVVEQVGCGMVWKWPESRSGYGCEFDKEPPIMRRAGQPLARVFVPEEYYLRPARPPEFYAWGETAPLSICRAALKFAFKSKAGREETCDHLQS